MQVDVSNPLWRKQKAAVDQTLEDMGVADKPTIVMLNKVDAVQVSAGRTEHAVRQQWWCHGP